jgi:hypothetical protein
VPLSRWIFLANTIREKTMIDSLPTPDDEPGWENMHRITTHRTNVYLWRKGRQFEVRLRKRYKTKKGSRERALFFSDWELPELIESLQKMVEEINVRRPS